MATSESIINKDNSHQLNQLGLVPKSTELARRMGLLWLLLLLLSRFSRVRLCATPSHPTRWHPTRLPRPWDSPGKNTGVGCHFLLQCVKVKSESEVAQLCPTLSDPMDGQPTRLLCPWDFPGKSAGVGCHDHWGSSSESGVNSPNSNAASKRKSEWILGSSK